MSFEPSFKINSIVTNNKIIEEFKCGNAGGMRKSNETNTLILISDHTKNFYDDKWYGNILHYTGMGKKGNQDINFMQNKTLAESNTNNVNVYLFEVFEPKKYIFRGRVKLISDPFLESQKDADGNYRSVYVFPLKLENEENLINKDFIDNNKLIKENKIKKISLEALREKAEYEENNGTSSRQVETKVFIRNPYVSEYVKKKANGICQLCGEKAPFKTKDNVPYLETHHIIWLSEGGPDTIDNVVALCPNCHRKMHVINLEEDKKILLEKNNEKVSKVEHEMIGKENL
ncbi:MAG: 5-methylcytosine-specific restriction enzyme [Kosmotogales bacterium]|nr:5-methylcytosine-specific restriction enzyme [Kosmotogales bacterium]